ncbi:isoleucyl-tRNA synthetase [Sulfurospirillum sp. 1307]
MLYIVNSFFMGIIFVSILDFLYFIGLKINYFDFYGISEYFNIIFVDNQNFYMLLPLSFVVGYLLLYSAFSKFFFKIYLVVLIASLFTLYAPVGKAFGDMIFKQENQQVKVGSTLFEADVLYMGRSFVYMYRKDIDKTIKLKVDEVTF